MAHGGLTCVGGTTHLVGGPLEGCPSKAARKPLRSISEASGEPCTFTLPSRTSFPCFGGEL